MYSLHTEVSGLKTLKPCVCVRARVRARVWTKLNLITLSRNFGPILGFGVFNQFLPVLTQNITPNQSLIFL